MKRKILPMGILPILLFALISKMIGKDIHSAKDSVMVTVTNISDVVNGDTSNIAALKSNPGPDGISFREALYASNGIAGEKTMTFHLSLSGDTITFASDGDLLLLSSGELNINGDINADGKPDITLDGHLGQVNTPSGPGLSIVSSDNTVTGLNFYEFAGCAIQICCPDVQCGTRFFANNKIINNTITSQRGAGIGIGPGGLRSPEEFPLDSDIMWQGTVIQGNTIATKDDAIRFAAAVGGGDRNQMLNLTISDNHLSSQALHALDGIVADVSSDYFGLPGPINYSDHNVIDTLIITNNIMADSRHGFHFICANYGNSQNKLQNVKFTGNTITNMQIRGIDLELAAGGNKEKETESNLIANVEITQNKISQTWQGIYIGGGHDGPGIGANNNRIENVLIAENEIYDYTMSGVGLIGGESKSEVVSGNILDLITISENNIYQTVNQGSGVGLSIVGALSSNGSSLQNLVRLHLLNNRISKNGTGIQVFGGDGPGAEDNQVILAKVQGNILIGNSKPWEIRDNINGAVNNLVTGTVTTPTFSPPPGTYTAAIDVSISCEIPGATIRFTTDESTPTEASPIYASPIRIDTTTTIKTRAYLNDWNPSEVATATYTISAQASVTVTVTNVSDVVNGNTSNIAALNSDPGPDGISFREALYASNGTAGQKTMTFHQSLSGATITFAADGELLLLSSGELTINGDIDGNGHPDITLDGHLGQDEIPSGVGLSIVSSDNKLTGVNFYEFAGRAIQICCPDAQCGTRLFANNKIINNTITSQRGAGIEIGPLGLIGDQAAPHLSDIIWRGTVIQGNTITTKNDAIRFAAAVGGGDTNQMLNLTISNNYLSSQALHAIDGIVADVNSDYFGLPGPINYSDHNVIDTLIITNNIMEDSRHGFNFICANYGNSQNKLQNVKFTGNTITNMQIRGIEIELVQADDEEKATESNLIANVEITQNTISQTWQAIYIGGGHQGSGVGANNNRIENVLIAENEIYDYTTSGVGLTGGDSNSEVVSGNILDLITISENKIYQTVNQGSGFGLKIVGGSTSNGSSLQNLVRLHLLNNRISENGTGIQVFGGDRPGAEDNQVILAKVQGNILIGNSKPWEIRDNINGAVNNLVTGTVTTPTFSPSPGTYTTAIDVSIGCEIPGAVIRFTTNESVPTESSPIYTSAIRIDTTTTIKARAYLSNWTPSEVATAVYTIDIEVAVESDDLNEIPKAFALCQNYPNPFNPETAIRFQLAEATEVEIKIYNLRGEVIITLLSERKQPGIHNVLWDGTDEKGSKVASGIYLYQMKTAQYQSFKKLLLIR